MRPAGPSGPSGTSHSNVHLPGKYSSKLKGGSASSDFVGRPRSGIWPFGSGDCGGVCAASAVVIRTAPNALPRRGWATTPRSHEFSVVLTGFRVFVLWWLVRVFG